MEVLAVFCSAFSCYFYLCIMLRIFAEGNNFLVTGGGVITWELTEFLSMMIILVNNCKSRTLLMNLLIDKNAY